MTLNTGSISNIMRDGVLTTETEWREDAACLEYPAILFFGVDDSETPADRRAREERAKRVCWGCGVRRECLDYALATKEPYGIWGGLTEIERRGRVHSRSN
ncbi:MAG TPA: WhiB family transcriptional regulator [Actinomycetota bacterium]|nr:WhiB family transcriptional regulator [Actinomycetota bacterium]